MSDHVWVLQRGMMPDSHLLPDFMADFPTDDSEPEGGYPQPYMRAAVGQGLLMPEEYIPKKAISRFKDSKVNLQRDIFILGMRIVVSQRIYNVIKDFNFGDGGRFHSVTPYRKGKLDTPLSDAFYIMNFAGKKDALLPDFSNNIKHRKDVPGLERYTLLDIKNDDLVVSRAALEGPDVWIDRVMSEGQIFFSGPLGDAIKAAKPKGRLPMYRCKVHEYPVQSHKFHKEEVLA